MAEKISSENVTVYKQEKAYDGYTLFTPISGDGTVYLIDMMGQLVHTWKMLYPGWLARLLPNGHLLFDGKTEAGFLNLGGKTGVVIEAGWEGDILWKYEMDTLHHDHFRKPNGNTILLCWEKLPEEMASKIKGGLPSRDTTDKTMWSDMLFEIDRNGKVIWDWHSHEHLDPEEDAICPFCSRREWAWCNAVFVTPNGGILTSLRQINTVGIIDRGSGDWKWKFGRGILGHQHDPTQLENGNILIFDNGAHIPDSPRSRVIEVDPKDNKIVWEYSDPNYLGFFSFIVGGAQRLPNGNTLICEGYRGRIFEVTLQKEIVWEYRSPFKGKVGGAMRNMLFRAYRYGPEYSGLTNL